MPPTQGVFPVPYGTTPTHNQPGAVISASAVGVGAQVIGPGIGGGAQPAGGFPQSQHHQSGKSSRLPGVSGVLNGLQIDGGHDVYGPGIGHGLHAHGHSLQPPHGHQQLGGPSSRHGMSSVPSAFDATSGAMEESLGRKEKRKKDSSKHKDSGDRRDDPSRHMTERISVLINTAHFLCTRPESLRHFQLRLYPSALERSALLAQFEAEERYAIELAQVAYDEDRDRVEEEWKRGRDRVRDRLIEGIEERRKRAREEKEGEGTVDASLDSHSRLPITRKLRNKLGGGTSPPPTPQTAAMNGLPSHHSLGTFSSTGANGHFSSTSNLPITTGPFLNPHSLNVDDLPSPFPLPLTASGISHSSSSGALGSIGVNCNGIVGVVSGGGASAGIGGGPTIGNGGRRRVKPGAGHQSQTLGGLGKSLAVFNIQKESIELENDLNEIKRGNKRRRAAAAGVVKS